MPGGKVNTVQLFADWIIAWHADPGAKSLGRHELNPGSVTYQLCGPERIF